MKESSIEAAIVPYLCKYGWKVWNVHGNMFTSGLPDKYITHPKHRQRWLELKKPKNYRFTKDQLRSFPLIHACGVGIWIMTSVKDYELLFKPPNWYTFLKPKDKEHIRKLYEGTEFWRDIYE